MCIRVDGTHWTHRGDVDDFEPRSTANEKKVGPPVQYELHIGDLETDVMASSLRYWVQVPMGAFLFSSFVSEFIVEPSQQHVGLNNLPVLF
jgi:hypothetical protein